MRTIAALALLLGTLSCGSALAQHARGVPLHAITPRGMHLVDVDVPEVERVPVRLRYAPSPQARAELLVDVLVATGAPSAAAAAAWFRETVSGELPALDGIGDAAMGDARLVAFVEGDVHVVVRRVAGAHDTIAIARGIASAIDPARRVEATGVTLDVRSPQIGAAEPIEVEGALAVHVTATAPGHARRTRDGWVLSRSADGPIELRVVIVDHLLRRTERALTLR